MKIADLIGPLPLREAVRTEPAFESVQWFHYDYYPEVLERMVNEYRSGKYPRAPWKVVPAARLAKIWADHAARGFVRDQKGLEAIRDQFIENITRLLINTEIAGHTESNPKDILADHFDTAPEEPEERDDEDDWDGGDATDPIEAFVEWAIELPTGGWRISDYGFPRLFHLACLMYEAETPEDLLVYVDQVLNVTHQRSDLASWFVEGGTATLTAISSRG